MIAQDALRLGDRVLFGPDRLPGVVDGLCRDWVGVRLERGGYVRAEWKDVYREEEN